MEKPFSPPACWASQSSEMACSSAIRSRTAELNVSAPPPGSVSSPACAASASTWLTV